MNAFGKEAEGGATMLSRSGSSSCSGKPVKLLDVPCSEELEDAVIAAAAIAGVPKSEYVRPVLERNFFGELSMIRRMSRTASSIRLDECGTRVG